MAVKWIKVSGMENKFLVEKSRVRRYFEEEIRPLSYFRHLSLIDLLTFQQARIDFLLRFISDKSRMKFRISNI